MSEQLATRLADLPVVTRRILCVARRPTSAKFGVDVVDGFALAIGFMNPLAWAYLGVRQLRKLSDETPDKLGNGICFAESPDSSVTFPPGHPSIGRAYVSCPHSPQHYVPLETLHREILRQKASEMFRLLVGLRADTVRVEVRGNETERAEAGIAALIPTDVVAHVEARMEGQRTSSSFVRFDAKISGRGKPTVPAGLVWYQHEPEWKAVTSARMNGATSFSLRMRNLDDLGVNAALVATLEGAGIKLGGSFEKFVGEEWIVTGTFASKPILGW